MLDGEATGKILVQTQRIVKGRLQLSILKLNSATNQSDF